MDPSFRWDDVLRNVGLNTVTLAVRCNEVEARLASKSSSRRRPGSIVANNTLFQTPQVRVHGSQLSLG